MHDPVEAILAPLAKGCLWVAGIALTIGIGIGILIDHFI